MDKNNNDNLPNKDGYYGAYGGRYVPDTLYAPLREIEIAFRKYAYNDEFNKELEGLMQDFVGRETPLYYAKRLTEKLGGAKIYLKREDLAHTGAHKINNAVGQILLAKAIGKTRIVAETGAGQHGVATAAVAAHFGMECVVYMGAEDVKRQAPNVRRMELLGAKVAPVENGQKTLKDAVSEAMRDWVTNVDNTYYLLGSALGPHPYPMIVRHFQSCIGREAKKQILIHEGRLPDTIVACVGGGSNSIGIFSGFLGDKSVDLIGVEAGGTSSNLGMHAARFAGGQIGVFQGMKSYLLQDEDGQIADTASISAGLDYASVGPEHAYLRDLKRATYTYIRDEEAYNAFCALSQYEGIIPALESSHAVAHAMKIAPNMDKSRIIIVNLSGRGDKDMGIIENYEKGLK